MNYYATFTMIKAGERVKCIDKDSIHFEKEGVFTSWVANGLSVKFDNGEQALFLPNSLKKI